MKWLSSLRRDSAESDAPSAAADPGDAPTGPSLISTLVDSQSPAPVPTPSTEPLVSTCGDGGPAGQPVPVDGAAHENSAEPAGPQDAGRNQTAGPATDLAVTDALVKLRDELLQKQQSLGDEQRALNDLFSTRLRSDEAQGRAVEKLHDELRQYKANFIRQQLLPVLKEVIFCHDFVVAQMERSASASEEKPERAALEATRQMLIDLLFKYDVEPFRTEDERFDPKSQQCTQTVPSPRSEADKTVATRGLPGFRGPEGIVRREQVTVYKFTPGAD